MMTDGISEQEVVKLILDVLDGKTVTLSGEAKRAWLAKEFGHLKPKERSLAYAELRMCTSRHDRMREYKRETDFAIAFHIDQLKRRKERFGQSRRPAPSELFKWDPGKSPATNAFNMKKWLMMGGAPCR